MLRNKGLWVKFVMLPMFFENHQCAHSVMHHLLEQIWRPALIVLVFFTNSCLGDFQHDFLSIRDASEFDPECIMSSDLRNWLLVQIIPAPESGTGSSTDWEKDPQTDAWRLRKEASVTLLVKGRINILAELSGTGSQSESYDWTEALQINPFSHSAPIDNTNPFGRGGVAVLRHNRNQSNASRFESISLFPVNWTQAVVEACAYFKEHPKALSHKSHDETVKALRALRAVNNPVLSTVSFRRLVTDDLMTADEYRELLRDAKEYLKSAYVYLSLTRSQSDVLKQELIDSIRSASPDELKDIAMGLITADMSKHIAKKKPLAEALNSKFHALPVPLNEQMRYLSTYVEQIIKEESVVDELLQKIQRSEPSAERR